jgi:hypothetical protein
MSPSDPSAQADVGNPSAAHMLGRGWRRMGPGGTHCEVPPAASRRSTAPADRVITQWSGDALLGFALRPLTTGRGAVTLASICLVIGFTRFSQVFAAGEAPGDSAPRGRRRRPRGRGGRRAPAARPGRQWHVNPARNVFICDSQGQVRRVLRCRGRRDYPPANEGDGVCRDGSAGAQR